MEAMDCATRLNAQSAAAAKAAGIVAVGRYLGYKNHTWSKTLTPDELKVIHAAGLSVFLIWESDPTFAGYFAYSQGAADAKAAVEEANFLGAPKGTAIYFTVDFDAQAANMAAIIAYFEGVRAGIGQYLVGVYGSNAVCTALKNSNNKPDRYWQTYAWSGGSVFAGNIYQYQNGVTIAGISADRDRTNTAPGAWPEVTVAQAAPVAHGAPANTIGTLVITSPIGLNLRQQPNTTSTILAAIPNKTTCPVFEASQGWYEVTYGGHMGWVSGKYVTYTAKPVPKPVTPPVTQTITTKTPTAAAEPAQTAAPSTVTKMATTPTSAPSVPTASIVATPAQTSVTPVSSAQTATPATTAASLDNGILIFTDKDFVTAEYLASSLGDTVAIFVLKMDGTPPASIALAKHLFVIGELAGGVNHPNQTVLTGQDWFQTVAAVAKEIQA